MSIQSTKKISEIYSSLKGKTIKISQVYAGTKTGNKVVYTDKAQGDTYAISIDLKSYITINCNYINYRGDPATTSMNGETATLNILKGTTLHIESYYSFNVLNVENLAVTKDTSTGKWSVDITPDNNTVISIASKQETLITIEVPDNISEDIVVNYYKYLGSNGTDISCQAIIQPNKTRDILARGGKPIDISNASGKSIVIKDTNYKIISAGSTETTPATITISGSTYSITVDYPINLGNIINTVTYSPSQKKLSWKAIDITNSNITSECNVVYTIHTITSQTNSFPENGEVINTQETVLNGTVWNNTLSNDWFNANSVGYIFYGVSASVQYKPNGELLATTEISWDEERYTYHEVTIDKVVIINNTYETVCITLPNGESQYMPPEEDAYFKTVTLENVSSNYTPTLYKDRKNSYIIIKETVGNVFSVEYEKLYTYDIIVSKTFTDAEVVSVGCGIIFDVTKTKRGLYKDITPSDHNYEDKLYDKGLVELTNKVSYMGGVKHDGCCNIIRYKSPIPELYITSFSDRSRYFTIGQSVNGYNTTNVYPLKITYNKSDIVDKYGYVTPMLLANSSNYVKVVIDAEDVTSYSLGADVNGGLMVTCDACGYTHPYDSIPETHLCLKCRRKFKTI